jgi:UDP-N-acetylmuramate--alanine ligase
LIGALFQKLKDIHFVGVGGVGMSGIAEILLNLGFRVSGSDIKVSGATKRLEDLGARICIGHSPDNIGAAEVVVFTSAATWDNPELVAAREAMIPVIPRAEMLAELMRMQTSIAVAGMHGKTTTTSMIATILGAAGLDPTVIIGGKLDTLGGGAKLGQGDLLVAEADESDRSFLKLYPTIALITNLDMEHVESYNSMDEVRSVFLEFINRIPFYGYAIVCIDDPEVQNLIPSIEKRFLTYGFASQAAVRGRDLSFKDGVSTFTVFHEDMELGQVRLPMPGAHNVQDALAAIAIAEVFQIPFNVIREALESFQGVQRRFTLRGKVAGISVIDDYGHHPTEIKAVLSAARQLSPKRIAALFQPHRYTRTKGLFDEFLTAFHDADLLYITDIYAASEKPIEGITAEALCNEIRKRGHKTARYVGSLERAIEEVCGDLAPGDMLITLGAGDITTAGPRIVERLKAGE